MKAASAHHSQLTDLIRDDPNGCRLPAQVLAQFEQRWEFLFFSQMTQSLTLATASVRRLRPAVLPSASLLAIGPPLIGSICWK
jgi:hypothetical protein